MPVPSPRNPIRPARGNYVDLAGNISQLYDGEMCYAIDEDQMYMNEGGTLVPVGVQLNQSGINDIGDILVTNAQNGEALIYNDGNWKNGGNMDGGNF